MTEKNNFLTSRLWRGSPVAADRLTSLVFYFSILLFLIGFNFSDNMVGNWYQQSMPITPSWAMRDSTFVDSVTRYASIIFTDTSYILKTTNSGDNWQFVYKQYQLMTRLQFINTQTGFAGGGYLYKTTNGGI
jgi:hypothetical protein